MRLLLLFSLSFILFGCSDATSTKETIDKELVENKAEIGLTKNEVSAIFGEEYFSGKGEGENTEVWVYDKVKDDFEYEKSVQRVPFQEISNGDVEYQLFINFVGDESFMYLYIYRGEDGELRQYQVNPDGTKLERKM